jgi:uncharacterized protein
MSDLQKNKDLVRAILKHIGDFNIQEIGKLVTDDVIWWVNGGSQDGQYFYGKEASLKLIGVVGENLVDSKIQLEIVGMIAEGDRVAVEVRSYGTMKNGNEYRNSYHEIYEIRDGLVALCKEYADTKYSADVGIRPRGPQNDISASIHRPGLGSGWTDWRWAEVICAVDLGVSFVPLICPAACPGVAAGCGAGRPLGSWRVRTGSGLVRPRLRAGRRPLRTGHPLAFVVPAFGQVQRDVPAAVPGRAGGDVDQVAAQRGAAGPGMGEAGQGPGGAKHIMGDGGAGQPGGIGGKRA